MAAGLATPIKNINMTFSAERLQQQLDFIVEVDKLKHIFRRTILIDASRRENDAEHSWHLSMCAILLQEYAIEKIDLCRVLKMVTIHDLIEIYAGDTFAFDVEANKDKAQREELAADKLFSQLPEDQAKEIRSLWEEFDAMNTPDSRYAASLDRIQPFIHNTKTGGHTWIKGCATEAQVLERTGPIKTGTPALWPWILENIEIGIKEGWISK